MPVANHHRAGFILTKCYEKGGTTCTTVPVDVKRLLGITNGDLLLWSPGPKGTIVLTVATSRLEALQREALDA